MLFQKKGTIRNEQTTVSNLKTITVPWENQPNIWWNETCATILEHFGLPGGKYTTELSEDFMHFHFENEQDAFMCKILVSDCV
jgi:hypothetical protein